MSKALWFAPLWVVIAFGCSREAGVQSADAPTPIAAPSPAPAAPAPMQIAVPPVAPAAPPIELTPATADPPPVDVYAGTHKLGVNRVTDMARVGSVTFSRRDGALHLKGRVERGKHWLELEGTVETAGPKTFHLTGTITGVPDMAWARQAPRERRTEGRFTFEVKKGRPYWRLYEVNGRDCVCWENCGNDFCYIDIERQPAQ